MAHLRKAGFFRNPSTSTASCETGLPRPAVPLITTFFSAPVMDDPKQYVPFFRKGRSPSRAMGLRSTFSERRPVSAGTRTPIRHLFFFRENLFPPASVFFSRLARILLSFPFFRRDTPVHANLAVCRFPLSVHFSFAGRKVFPHQAVFGGKFHAQSPLFFGLSPYPRDPVIAFFQSRIALSGDLTLVTNGPFSSLFRTPKCGVPSCSAGFFAPPFAGFTLPRNRRLPEVECCPF